MSRLGHSLDACSDTVRWDRLLLGEPSEASRFYNWEEWDTRKPTSLILREGLSGAGLSIAFVVFSILTLITPLAWVSAHQCCRGCCPSMSSPHSASYESDTHSRRGQRWKNIVFVVSAIFALITMICIAIFLSMNQKEGLMSAWSAVATTEQYLSSISFSLSYLQTSLSLLAQSLKLARDSPLIASSTYNLLREELGLASEEALSIRSAYDRPYSEFGVDAASNLQAYSDGNVDWVKDYSDDVEKFLAGMFGTGLVCLAATCVGLTTITKVSRWVPFLAYCLGSSGTFLMFLASCYLACLLTFLKDGCPAAEPVLLNSVSARWLPLARYALYGTGPSLDAALLPLNVTLPSLTLSQLQRQDQMLDAATNGSRPDYLGNIHISGGPVLEALRRSQVQSQAGTQFVQDIEEAARFETMNAAYLEAKGGPCCQLPNHLINLWILATLAGWFSMLMTWLAWWQLLHVEFQLTLQACFCLTFCCCCGGCSERQQGTPGQSGLSESAFMSINPLAAHEGHPSQADGVGQQASSWGWFAAALGSPRSGRRQNGPLDHGLLNPEECLREQALIEENIKQQRQAGREGVDHVRREQEQRDKELADQLQRVEEEEERSREERDVEARLQQVRLRDLQQQYRQERGGGGDAERAQRQREEAMQLQQELERWDREEAEQLQRQEEVLDMERQGREVAERLQREQERLNREEAERMQRARERSDREEAERLQREQERLDRQEAERFQREQEMLIREEAEYVQREQERLIREEADQLQREQERLMREEAEQFLREQERADREEAERLQGEQDRLAAQQAQQLVEEEEALMEEQMREAQEHEEELHEQAILEQDFEERWQQFQAEMQRQRQAAGNQSQSQVPPLVRQPAPVPEQPQAPPEPLPAGIRLWRIAKTTAFGDSRCPACWVDYTDDMEVKQNACQHVMCKGCSESWTGGCPICRAPT